MSREIAAKRVIVLLNKASGGIDRMIANFLDGLDKDTARETTVICRDAPLLFRGSYGNVKAFAGPSRGLSVRTELCVLWEILNRANEARLVLNPHDRIGLAYCSFVKLLRWRRVRLVPTVHQLAATLPTSWWRRKIFSLFEWIGLRLADRVICVSKERCRAVVTLGIAHDRVVTVPNGVNTEIWQRTSERQKAARMRLGIAEHAVCFCYVGRLSEEKGIQDLLLVYLEIIDSMPGSVLLIAGDGLLRTELAAHAEHLGNGAIRLLGTVDDVLSVYCAADVLVQPSRDEGLSMTVLEGMSCGLPVVATDVGGNPEVVDSTVGVLVRPRCSDSLAEALLSLWRDRTAIAAKGAAARERVLAKYDSAAMTRRTLAVLDELSNRTR